MKENIEGEPGSSRSGDASFNPTDMTSVITVNDLLRLIQQTHSMLAHLSLKIHELEQRVDELREERGPRWLVDE